MKKIIIILNIFVILFLFIIAELFCANHEYVLYTSRLQPEERMNYSILKYMSKRYKPKTFYNDNNLREPSGLQYLNKKPAIILIGCSYTFGANLNNNETFSYQLAQYTKRPVYNYGIPGGGPREMLHLLRTNKIIDIFNIDKNNVDYIIYTYIYDHQRRLYSNLRPLVPNYKKTKDNRLIEKKQIKFLNKLFIKQYLNDLNFSYWDYKNSFNLLTVYIKEINKEICNKFSFTPPHHPPKFVILVYRSPNNEKWDLLKDEKNIQVIKVEDLIGKNISKDPKFLNFDNDHPNAKAWEVIVPALAKELNL